MPQHLRMYVQLYNRFTLYCTLPELARTGFVVELLEREAAMLIALERIEAGMVVCLARD